MTDPIYKVREHIGNVVVLVAFIAFCLLCMTSCPDSIPKDQTANDQKIADKLFKESQRQALKDLASKELREGIK